jgi:uncharacterized protein YqhQ
LKKTTIGGQAILEGLLMMGPRKYGYCRTQADGEIVSGQKTAAKSHALSKYRYTRICQPFQT